MKKLKDIWRNNRILFVLFIILVICFIAIITVALTYFVGSENSPYGNRLDNKVELPNNFEKDMITKLKEDEEIQNANVRLAIRTIYVTIDFVPGVSLEKAQQKAVESLQEVDENIFEYYDFNYILTEETTEDNKGFTIMGARNSYGTGFIWNNNIETDEKE